MVKMVKNGEKWREMAENGEKIAKFYREMKKKKKETTPENGEKMREN
jgi:hypothetical protein